MFVRSIFAALVSTALIVMPAVGQAATATPTPGASASAAAEHPRDGGIIAGKISSVDYQRNVITVNHIEISVMPSTQIQGNDATYHAFSDLKPGMSVEIYTSQVAGKYIAQIITLR